MVALGGDRAVGGRHLALEPPASGDLAAATYRGELFARAGFTLWNDS